MKTNLSNAPAVYIGTYKKYNNGNLSGAWVNLVECGTYSNFLEKIRNIHSDEKDPEYMIQDYENFPDGIDSGEWLSEKDFNDVIEAYNDSLNNLDVVNEQFTIVDYSEKAFAVIGDTKSIKDKLKSFGGRFNAKLSCGPGWIFSKTKLEEVKAFIGGGEIKKEEKESSSFKNYLNEFAELKDDPAYYKKQYSIVLKMEDGIYIPIEKSKIENRFCFHDEGPGYELYKKVTETELTLKKYFLNRNLNELKSNIENFSNPQNGKKVWIDIWDSKSEQCTVAVYDDYSYDRNKGTYGHREATPNEIGMIIEAYKIELSNFEKRLQTYLKRYGVSKIDTWTYWADA